jgi:3-methylfumaryl-CoA hydratase
MSLDPAIIDHWRSWVDRSETRSETIDVEALRRFAAAIGEDLDVESRLPSLAHWACFLPVAAPGDLGPDGHSKRGGFQPPVTLQRRMFAASTIDFHAPLVPGAEATRTARIASLEHKSGRSGELVLVEVDYRTEQGGALKVAERQTIVYRDPGTPLAAPVPADLPMPEGGELWQPTSVDLFRFSAVTFNSHRIHYDVPYATGEEGYPGLVVHGPFTAVRLFGLARRTAMPKRFSFRASAPLFLGQKVLLAPGPEEGAVLALRCDGITAMSASAVYPD